jgi:putative transposase
LRHKDLRRFASSGLARYDSASPNPNGEAAMGVVRVIVHFLRAVLGDRAALVAENLALRQQLAILQVSAKRPTLRKRDRAFWVWLSRLWSGWRSCLMIVEPETVIRWHREGFRLYWR